MNRYLAFIPVALLCFAACHASSETTTPVQSRNGIDKVRIVNQPGALISMDEVLVQGSVTVIEFYADWCRACKVVEKKLLRAIHREPRIVVRKINVKDGTSEVARHYEVGVLPHLRIFDSAGKLAYVLVGNNTKRAGELAFEVLARK